MPAMNHEANIIGNFSDEDIDETKELGTETSPVMQGTLCKWTNYIHGWQDRYFVLRDGTMSYYRSQGDASFGCRGSISVSRAIVKPHEIDECRFDVCLNDCVWYLRTGSQEEKHQWVDAIELNKERNGLPRHGSSLSLTSASLSTTSAKKSKGGLPHTKNTNVASRRQSLLSSSTPPPSYQQRPPSSSTPPPQYQAQQHRTGLREKMAELDTYRDILIKQMDTLQSFFDACSDITKNGTTHMECNGDHVELLDSDNGGEGSTDTSSITLTKEVLERHGGTAVDFKGEALTFKATSAGIITTLSHCVDVMNQREEAYKRKLEREQERRRRLEDKLLQFRAHVDECGGCGGAGFVGVGSVGSVRAGVEDQLSGGPPSRVLLLGGPDYEEGPHSVMGEDEFYDAVESTLDKMDEEDQFRERLRQRRNAPGRPPLEHPLGPEIDSVTAEQLGYALEDVTDEGTSPSSWLLFAEEGEMKLYRREVEVDGLVMDPCKALHKVEGVTAHEMAHHFWSPDVRFEWDTSIEQVTVLDFVDESTLIFLQVHKRVWPIAQRDALFWSHIRKIENDDPLVSSEDPLPYDTWIVCNRSTEHPDALNDGKCVRIILTVCFVCQTFIVPPLRENETADNISRDRLLTKIIYCSNVSPGGWAPASVLRAVFKREYPKFVRRFSHYVADKCRGKPISFDGLVILNKSQIWRG